MKTWTSGDHIYHERQDDDDFWRQANKLFGHRLDWRRFCTLCQEHA